MAGLRKALVNFFERHKRAVLLWVVVLSSCGMVFKGLMQQPQINKYEMEIAELEQKIVDEKDRQAEIEDLKTKVNTDEYIERIASEKLGLVKSNAKIFIDISDEN